ncbi:MAG: RDD family protein [Peptococcaceae bacterium]|nr:RDD family protein [Peptococcaceae bacterium]
MNHGLIDITTPEHVRLRYQMAGLGSRAAAFLIDTLIIYTILLCLSISIVSLGEPGNWGSFSGFLFDWLYAVILVIVFFINFGYFALFEYFWAGQTLGKRILGLQVVGKNGEPITFISAIIRNFLRLIDSMFFYAAGVGFIFIHPRHQRLGDLAAGTIVIHRMKGKKASKRLAKTMSIRLEGIVPLVMEESVKKRFTYEDWHLLHMYAVKSADLSRREKWDYSQRITWHLLPKAGIEPHQGMDHDRMLLALFLALREDWDPILTQGLF